MKVAFFSTGLAYRLGGPAFSEAYLIRELRKTVQVDVFIPDGRAEKEFLDDYRVFDVTLYDPKKVMTLNNKIKTADVIHLNGHWKWWYSRVARLAQTNGIPYILHPRGMLLVGHRRKQLKKVFNLAMGNAIVHGAEKIIALSEYEKGQFRTYRINEEKIQVIPNPIEAPTFKTKAKPELPSGVSEYYLYLGRIESRKNLVFLVKAFSQYRRLGGKASLLIVGPVEHGYDAKIRRAIYSTGQESSVFLMPAAYEEKRDQLLQHSIGLIYPATDEPFGRVPFEAVTMGTVPVVPDLGGAAEYLGGFFPECIYVEGDALDLGKTLVKVESMDRSRLTEARDWVADKLNLATISKQVLSLYSEVQSQTTTTAPLDISSKDVLRPLSN